MLTLPTDRICTFTGSVNGILAREGLNPRNDRERVTNKINTDDNRRESLLHWSSKTRDNNSAKSDEVVADVKTAKRPMRMAEDDIDSRWWRINIDLAQADNGEEQVSLRSQRMLNQYES